MRAFQIQAFGEPVNLTTLAEPQPQSPPAPGHIRLKIQACGLNFADLLMLEGRYQERPQLPFILGMEPAGTVQAIGEGVTGLQVGDRVAVFHSHGGLAEIGEFPADHCHLLPPSMPIDVAAGFLIAYGTSHLVLAQRANLQAGETLLVLGASGGIGLTAVEIGKRMGATVIACARGADKLDIAAKAGADHLIDSESGDLREQVKALGGADVVYDPVGGELFKQALRACNPLARIIPVGFASGDVPQIPANILLVKNLSVIGFYWAGYLKFAPELLQDSLKTLFQWYENGDLAPHISHRLPLERVSEALELLRSRKSTGKVVVTM
ncbi:MAG: zinc-binding dehydrogenase [Rhodobacterales bacterium]|nr:MAG: zinc-binding dehydrogenase [Rhodobacterales bacterium]